MLMLFHCIILFALNASIYTMKLQLNIVASWCQGKYAQCNKSITFSGRLISLYCHICIGLVVYTLADIQNMN